MLSTLWKCLISLIVGIAFGYGIKPSTIIEQPTTWEIVPFHFGAGDWYSSSSFARAVAPKDKTQVEALRPSCPYHNGYRYRRSYRCGVDCHFPPVVV